MKNCTRKDVVSANLRRDTKDQQDATRVPNLHWELKRKSMNNSNWEATDTSLISTSEQAGCNLDVSIVYENTLKKFVHELKFNSPQASNQQPSELSSTIVSDLNTLSSLASDLARKLTESTEVTESSEPADVALECSTQDEQPTD
tara:strand:+ start:147 stop:581 length:435 start_codon:yes stop_codon:yes gene_type:complete